MGKKKNNNGTEAPLPGRDAPSSIQRSVTMDMPFLPGDTAAGGGAGDVGAPSLGGSGRGGGEGSSYYASHGAASIHGETVRKEKGAQFHFSDSCYAD